MSEKDKNVISLGYQSNTQIYVDKVIARHQSQKSLLGMVFAGGLEVMSCRKFCATYEADLSAGRLTDDYKIGHPDGKIVLTHIYSGILSARKIIVGHFEIELKKIYF